MHVAVIRAIHPATAVTRVATSTTAATTVKAIGLAATLMSVSSGRGLRHITIGIARHKSHQDVVRGWRRRGGSVLTPVALRQRMLVMAIQGGK